MESIPDDSTDPLSTISTKPTINIKVIFIIIVLFIVTAAGAYYLGTQDRTMISSNSFTKPSLLPNKLPSPTRAVTVSPEVKVVPIDSDWNKFTSSLLGFSINIPTMMTSYSGGCQWNANESSYRLVDSPVPVKVFTDGFSVYLSHEYYYQLGGERKVTQGLGTISYFDRCDRVTNSVSLLKERSNSNISKWSITVQKVRSDDELTAYIRSEYGSGCSIGEEKPSQQEGVYDVTIKGDGKDLGASQCFVNYIYAIKYYPAGNEVASWPVGQACTFMNQNNCLDQQIIDSFRFIN